MILAGAFEAVHIESLPAVDAGLMVSSFSSSHCQKLKSAFFSPLLLLDLWLILASAFEAVQLEALPAVDTGSIIGLYYIFFVSLLYY